MINTLVNLFRMLFLIEEAKLPDPPEDYSSKECIECTSSKDCIEDTSDPLAMPSDLIIRKDSSIFNTPVYDVIPTTNINPK